MSCRDAWLIGALAVVAACGGRGGSSDPDAEPGIDASQEDGPPVRRACTDTYGNALTLEHGRLDGILVSIVEPGHQGCNGDDTHVHLQVEADGAVYDVAINVTDANPVELLALDHAIPDGPWSEGWHPDQDALLDYPTTLDAHADDFTPLSQSALVSTLDGELADVNHIAVFMTGYGVDGGHEVHRKGSGQDGALVLQPLGAPRLLLFHFASQTF
jgi:hypothetical protein